jgi:hypothetical protein
MGRGDLDDQRWLAERVEALRDGIEAAHDIWLNWTDIRNVSRFCDGLTYGEFIHREVPQLGPDDVPRLAAAVPEMSSRELGKATGVSQSTARRAKVEVSQIDSPDEPARVIGADGKSYPGRVVGTTNAEIIEPVKKKEVRFRKNLNLTEVRQQIRIMEYSLAMLRPGDVVPTAIPVIREFAPKLDEWIRLWGQSEN